MLGGGVSDLLSRTYITFDYELFLGKETGTVENSLLRPTERYVALADSCQKKQVKFVFFVDTLYLLKLKEFSRTSPQLLTDYQSITKQLKDLVSKGHDAQLHLHPQWFYASYNDDNAKWDLDFEHYKLSDCPLPDVEKMLKESLEELEQITGYRPTAFRAGGYCFPTDPEYVELFRKYGVVEDSSVRMGVKAVGKYQSYDYSTVTGFYSYRFSGSITQKDDSGVFTEYPISVIKVNPVRYFAQTIRARRKHAAQLRVMGDGKGVGTTLPRSQRWLQTIKRFFNPVYMSASVDSTNAMWLNEVYEQAMKAKSDTMVIIGHPKNCTDFGLKGLEEFVRNRTCNYATFRNKQ